MQRRRSRSASARIEEPARCQSEAATATSRELGVELTDWDGQDSNTLPVASTFVIAEDGVIRFASVSGDYRWRVGPEKVLAALRA